LRIGVDIGGTFTDLVAVSDDNTLLNSKALSTPEDQAAGIMDCLAKANLNLPDSELFLHGCTVAINTVIERKGAKTALITTRGFRDVYEIGRCNRVESYNLDFHRPKPLIPRHLRFEITERMNYKGEILIPLAADEMEGIISAIEAEGVESIAVCFLHSYANPRHERYAAEILKKALPGKYVTISSDIMREFREYERTSTTALNAYVGPIVVKYLNSLEKSLHTKGFRGSMLMMQSNGGAMSAEVTKKTPVAMMESGPVSGVTGAIQVAKTLGYSNVISFDMGGTTAKTSLAKDGRLQYAANGYYIGGYASGQPMMLPVADIVEVGAGGGSIAWIDSAGALKIGPVSAGAVPGPVCYRRGGTEPTITDANLVLGRIGARSFLGGEMEVLVEEPGKIIEEKIAKPLNMSWREAAYGIIEIADTKMSLALRAVSIEKGYDPRDFVMVASGGAGPLHIMSLAKELCIPTVIIPNLPGQFSALGMLMSDLQHNYVQTHLSPLETVDADVLNGIISQMIDEGRRTLFSEGASSDQLRIQRFVDLRYIGQEFTISVPIDEDQINASGKSAIKSRFDEMHQRMYGHSAAEEKAEIIAVRLIAEAAIGNKGLSAVKDEMKGDGLPYGEREVFYSRESGFVITPVYRRGNLTVGQRIKGPAIIEEYASTTVVHPGDEIEVTPSGHIIVSVYLTDTLSRP
jgi:N-methylhydantoinase A